MSKELLRELGRVRKKEISWLKKTTRSNPLKDAVHEKVPDGLQNTLQAAFEKAFRLVFVKGTGIIEKTFNKEELVLEFEVENYAVDRFDSKKHIKRLGQYSRRSNNMNRAATTVTGLGLGALGLGLPDIPLLVSTILKGIYEIALSHGFGYQSEEERIYILRLIRTALATDADKLEYNSILDAGDYEAADFEEEIAFTAKTLSDALLVEKFIQGIPLVGMVGGIVNHEVYRKISALATIKYRKLYLLEKLDMTDL